MKRILNFWERLAGKVNTLKIPILYALIGGLGIWLSDKLFFTFVLDANQEIIVNIHIARGLLLILSSVSIICFLIHRSEKTLRESEERYRTLVELSPEPIMVVTKGELVYINKAGLQLLDPIRPEELHGKSIMDFIHPDYVELTKVWMQDIVADKKTIDPLEIKAIRNNGRPITLELKAMMIIYRDKLSMQLLARDVTSRKQAEEALRESETRLRTLINSIPDCIWFKDGEGRLYEINEYGQRLFDLEGIPYKGLGNVDLANNSQLYRNTILACEESDRTVWELGCALRTEEVIPRPDGTYKTFDFIKNPVWNADGSRQALVIIGRDITENIQAKKRLMESEAQFRSLFEHNPDAIYSFDQEGNLLAVNPIAEMITGYHSDELLKQSIRIMVSKESMNRTMEYFWESLKGKPQIYEITMLHKEGHQVECYAKNVPIIVNDKIVGVHVIVKDLTEQKRTQELLRRTDKLAVVGKLAAGIAHEIRNPLTTVKGFIQLLSRRIDGFQDYFSIMLREMDRIEVIVGEFLIIAKPQAKQIRLKDPLILLEDVITLLDSQANMNNVQFSLEAGLDIPLITCEENHLKQVFINVLKNAIESMPSGGKVEIKIEKIFEKSILIRIIDQGCGIPKERMPKLGEPFYTTKEKGTGLGLMVSYKIIEAHQGQINIMSEMGKGAIVEIILPIKIEKSNPKRVHPVEMLLINEFRR